MKQLLLRVPDSLHRRLADRAISEGRSVNSLATEVLELAADFNPDSRQHRLALRVATLGWPSTLSPSDREGALSHGAHDDAVAAMVGAGPLIEQILAEVRS